MAKETKNEGTEVVAEALSKTELFIKQYGKWMAYTLIALILVGVLIFGLAATGLSALLT